MAGRKLIFFSGSQGPFVRPFGQAVRQTRNDADVADVTGGSKHDLEHYCSDYQVISGRLGVRRLGLHTKADSAVEIFTDVWRFATVLMVRGARPNGIGDALRVLPTEN